MHRFEWPGDDSVEFHLGHGDMIRLLRRCGLEVEDLLELRPEPGSVSSHPLATLDWARQWPCEEVWKARKPGGEREPTGNRRPAAALARGRGLAGRPLPPDRGRPHISARPGRDPLGLHL